MSLTTNFGVITSHEYTTIVTGDFHFVNKITITKQVRFINTYKGNSTDYLLIMEFGFFYVLTPLLHPICRHFTYYV